MDALAFRVEIKLEEGNYRSAVRLACGSDSIAEHSPATLQRLKKKHPNPHLDHSFIPVQDADMFSVSISAEAVRKAIFSFPIGSVSGSDGLSP